MRIGGSAGGRGGVSVTREDPTSYQPGNPSEGRGDEWLAPLPSQGTGWGRGLPLTSEAHETRPYKVKPAAIASDRNILTVSSE
jgi:hypothetical protein